MNGGWLTKGRWHAFLKKVAIRPVAALVQSSLMADWKQIRARIHRAKSGADPLTKLSELFTKTRDAMVAWELAALEEKAGHNDEAVRWYTTAAQRFRRAEWKKKAEEALLRLGAPVPASSEAGIAEGEEVLKTEAFVEEGSQPATRQPVVGEIIKVEAFSDTAATGEPERPPMPGQVAETEHRKRHRGRRGGRGRRRKGAAAAPSLPTRTFVEPAPVAPLLREKPVERFVEQPSPRVEVEPPSIPERAAHGRAGEPALASRLAHLEALLRRLISSPLHRLDEADEAPAGPGVYLLSDSDLVTSYYVENCKTLRVALGHLVRGGRAAKGSQREGSVRSRLAEHLEISEAKVSQYLKQHCLVRWIQLDEEAPHLAHFAIAVLKPPLNAE